MPTPGTHSRRSSGRRRRGPAPPPPRPASASSKPHSKTKLRQNHDGESKGCLMGYRSLAECVRDLEATRQLVVIDHEVDPFLEIAAIQRRVYQAAGPALLFRNAKGTAFPILGNLFGTLDRTKYLFRDALESVRLLVELKVDPSRLAKNPWRYRRPRRPTLAIVAPAGALGADPRTSNLARPASPDPMLADGRRPVHHASARLHRRSQPARPGAIQPRHVPRAARGQRILRQTAKPACTIKSTAASACITPPRSRAANRCA